MSIIYNGHTFNSHANVSFNTNYIYDEAGTTIVRRQTILMVKDYIVPNSDDCTSIDVLMDDAKSRLSRAGMKLEISGHAFGADLTLNDLAAESEWDIKGGPKPQKLEIDPIGLNRVAHIVWQCEFNRGPCGNSGQIGVSAFNFQISYNINAAGYTTRSISGYLEIALRQSGGAHDPHDPGRIENSADNYRDYVTDHFPQMENAAQSATFSQSKDKSRLEFSISDKEHETPNAFPEGVVHISAPFRSAFKWPRAGTSLTNTAFSLHMELDAAAPRVRAWEIFDGLFSQRFDRYGQEGKTRILRELTVTEDTYTHKYTFHAIVTSTYPLFDQLRLLGYFTAVPGTWEDWNDSMHEAKDARGLSGHLLEPSRNMKLVSLCEEDEEEYDGTYAIIEPDDKTLFMWCQDRPDPENSWMDEDVALIEAPEMQSSVNTTYGQADVEQAPHDPDDDGQFSETTLVKKSGDYETCISEGAPILRYIWRGKVSRVGYPIPPPGKITIGGRDATIVGTPLFTTRMLGFSGCQPVYQAIWNIGLVVADNPTITDEDRVTSGTIGDGGDV